jgi:hypothetical protein
MLEDPAASSFRVLKMEAAGCSETFVFYHITMGCLNPEDHNVNVKLCPINRKEK